MKSRRLVQPVGNGQANAGGVRALGPDGRHTGVVKGAQGVKDMPGLLLLVPCRTQVHDGPRLRASREQRQKLVKTDDPVLRTGVGGDILRTLFRVTGDHGNRSLGSVVTVLHAAVRKLNVLGFSSVQERIAAWLLQETDEKGMVELKTNREEQADYLCVARPSLSRTLMQMQKAGIIETRRNQIRILDKEKLEKIL